MAQVTAVSERVVEADADAVFAALRDYRGTRQRILTPHFSEYEVRSGGEGAGSQVHYRLQATEKRVRDCLVEVSEPAKHSLVERDQNSSMVTTWTVAPAGTSRAAVRVQTTWNGAGGIGGFFEKTFAPLGLRRIYDGVLANLDTAVKS